MLIWTRLDFSLSLREKIQKIIFPDLLKYNWHIILCMFKEHNVVILFMYVLQNGFTIRLGNMFITSHSYNLYVCLWEENFKIYSFSSFQIYNKELTIVTMMYVTFLELINLITISLYPLITIRWIFNCVWNLLSLICLHIL